MDTNIWNDFVNQLVSWGYDRREICWGSIPQETLANIAKKVSGNGLQIGCFVGVSHCFLAFALKNKGTICSVDINIEHRGIENPLVIANKLVKIFNLQRNSSLICGAAQDQMRILKTLGVQYDFILLDGNHELKVVAAEIFAADQILKPKGLLLLDDIDNWVGPRTLYENFPLSNYKVVPLDSRVGMFEKQLTSKIKFL